MRIRATLLVVAIAVVGVVSFAGAALLAQVSASAPQSEVRETALLDEVKGLRADLQRILGANLRAQLLIASLQLQERRITSVAQHLSESDRELAAALAEEAAAISELGRVEKLLRGMLTADMRAQFEWELARLRPRADAAQRQSEQLRTKQGELQRQFDAETARWSTFSDQLYEIERQLPELDRAR